MYLLFYKKLLSTVVQSPLIGSKFWIALSERTAEAKTRKL